MAKQVVQYNPTQVNHGNVTAKVTLTTRLHRDHLATEDRLPVIKTIKGCGCLEIAHSGDDIIVSYTPDGKQEGRNTIVNRYVTIKFEGDAEQTIMFMGVIPA